MGQISNDIVLNEIREYLADDLIAHDEPSGMLTLVVKSERNIDLLKWLRDHETFPFVFMTDVCGIHYPENNGLELGVVYHLHCLIQNIRLRIKCFVPVANPVIQSATSVYKAANWQERETYDFYGIIFEGHPNLKRIVNVDEMDYFPLRKEYPLEDGTRTDKEDKYFGR